MSDEMVLAIDPGETTGWSLWWNDPYRPLYLLGSGLVQGGLKGFGDWVGRGPLAQFPIGIVICEHYVPDGRPGDPELAAPKIEAVLLFTLRDGRARIVLQPNTYKRQVSDAILQEHGLWVDPTEAQFRFNHTDGRDINDTMLHALAWAKTNDHQPTIAHYWPDNE